MKKVVSTIVVFILIISIFYSQFRLANHPISNNDEGIYLTSFLLIDRGHEPYKETFFSQPPGFILTTYPGFALFGKTLQAARLTVGFWSIIGFLALFWIGVELGSILMGFLAMGLLNLIPSYYQQTLIFQSDAVVGTFSLLTFAALLRFFNTKKISWFILASFFLNFAFWTKFDITFFPAFFLALYFIKVDKKKTGIFLLTSLLFFVIFILPFGIKEVFENSIWLRFQAANLNYNSFQLLNFLKKDLILFFMIIGGILLSFFSKEKSRFPLNIIFIWSLFSLIFFFFYRPLFPHHLAILSVPVVLLFSNLICLFLKSNKKLLLALIFLILTLSTINIINLVQKTPKQILYKDQKKAIDLILKNTKPEDIVVSDEEILTAISGRLPPPELADISLVRIFSNNLSSDNFKKIIERYKPKMIIAWNGRLVSIKNFNNILKNYKEIPGFKKPKAVYIRN